MVEHQPEVTGTCHLGGNHMNPVVHTFSPSPCGAWAHEMRLQRTNAMAIIAWSGRPRTATSTSARSAATEEARMMSIRRMMTVSTQPGNSRRY